MLRTQNLNSILKCEQFYVKKIYFFCIIHHIVILTKQRSINDNIQF